jgi:hypothetical protein
VLLQNGDVQEKDLIKGLDIERDQWGNIRLAPIILKIAGLGFPVREHLIFYFSTNESAFVFVGRDPLPEDTKISYDDINLSQKLIIKVKPHSSISPPSNEIKKLGAESFQQNQ